jgi:cyclin B
MLKSSVSRKAPTEDSVKPENEKRARKGDAPGRSFGRELTNVQGEVGGEEVATDVPEQAATRAVKKPLTSVPSITLAPSSSSSSSDTNDAVRSYMARPEVDIDARDLDKPLLCTEYVNQMYALFREAEKSESLRFFSDYMPTQPHITEKMRSILVDWLVEVHLKFKMVPESLYLTVNLVDRYLQRVTVRRSRLQLVGVACLMLASKYEEIYPPELRDLVYITDRAYTKQEIVEMENEVIRALQWNMTVPTIHSFLCRFLKAAHADRQMVQVACYVCERSLQEYGLNKYLPSMVAAASVLLARKGCRRNNWSTTLIKYTKYTEAEVMPCVQDLVAAINDSSCQQQAVFRKYSSPKFGAVSKIPLV